MRLNKATSLDAAMSLLFHIGCQRRGASERERQTTTHNNQGKNMKKCIAVLIAAATVLTAAATDASYSTEATVSLPNDNKGQYQVTVQVTEQIKRHGRVEEKLVGAPITATVGRGRKASTFTGSIEEGGVTVELSCPKPGDGDFASCTVTVTRRDKVVSVSKLRLKLHEKEPRV